MRYYKLEIDGATIAELNENNPFAPRLVANIQAYESYLTAAPASITIYNVPMRFFGLAKSFENKILCLKAGIKNSLLTRQQNLTPTADDIVYYGRIKNVLTSWDERDTAATFLLYGFGLSENEKSEIINKAFTIHRADNVADFFASVLREWAKSENKIVEITNKAKQVFYKDRASFTLKLSDSDINSQTPIQYIASLMKPYDLELSVGHKYTIRHNSENITDSMPKTLKADELINQPSFANVNTIQCEISLNPRYKLLDLIQMPQEIPLKTMGLIGGVGDILKATAQGSLIMKGTYKIQSISHTLDSRNTSPQSWATQFLAIRA